MQVTYGRHGPFGFATKTVEYDESDFGAVVWQEGDDWRGVVECFDMYLTPDNGTGWRLLPGEFEKLSRDLSGHFRKSL